MISKILRYNILSLLIFCNIFSGFCKKIVISAPIAEKEFIDRLDLDEVVFENECGIVEVPDYAFLGCENLRIVRLPDGLKKIGFQAFSECTSLEYINFPISLEDIGSNSFTYCEKLRDPQFPDGLVHIGHNAFSFCNSLEEIFLPDSLQEIESYAFSDCKSLRKVRFPANDKLLGELILNCCPSIDEITVQSPVPPPFDCDSYIFDPIDTASYSRCKLKVPEGSMAIYRESPSWSLFVNLNSSNYTSN